MVACIDPLFKLSALSASTTMDVSYAYQIMANLPDRGIRHFKARSGEEQLVGSQGHQVLHARLVFASRPAAPW